MSLKEQLRDAMKGALKARDQARLGTIRLVLSAIQYEEMQKGVDDLSDDDALAVLKRELKKAREELEFAEKGGREEARETLSHEISTIEEFLPRQLSEPELREILAKWKEAEPGLTIGEAMKKLKASYAGQYDAKIASDIAKTIGG